MRKEGALGSALRLYRLLAGEGSNDVAGRFMAGVDGSNVGEKRHLFPFTASPDAWSPSTTSSARFSRTSVLSAIASSASGRALGCCARRRYGVALRGVAI